MEDNLKQEVQDSLENTQSRIKNVTDNLKLSEVDRLALELSKANRRIALVQAEKAIAQNETSEMAYKYVVLQLYMKYGLTEFDAISEAGDILRGGAVPKSER